MSELDYWTGRLLKGAVSRREFMGRAAALGASSLSISTMLASADAFAAETPKNGGTLRLGLGGGSTTDSIDVTSYNDSVMIDTGHGLFDGIVEWGQDGRPHPDLAESLEPKNGARDWIFNLRKGIKFSNGQEFTADDAIYSLNLHRGDTKSGGASTFKPVTDIKKLDKYQIQISLTGRTPICPTRSPTITWACAGWLQGLGEASWDRRLQPRQVRSGRAHLAQEDARLLEGRQRPPRRVEVTVINDGSARLNALISGQIDAINRVDHKAVALLSKSPKIQIVRASGGWHAVMAMQCDKAPYDNPDIRMALKEATDREQILKALFSGYGTLGNDHPIPPTDPYFNSELPQRKYDPEKAAAAFKKAGLSDPKILLQASDAAFNGAVDEGALLQASAAKAGIKVDLKKEPADGFWDNVWLKGPFVSSYWGGRAAATQMLSVAYAGSAPWNETHWNNEKFEKLLADARGETDEAKRKPYIWEMQAMLNEQGGAIIPVFKDWLDAHNDKVGGHTPHGGFDMDNGYIMQKAWIKS